MSSTNWLSQPNISAIVSSKRTRCCLFFLAAGVGIGAWAASLPLVSNKLAIDKGELGLILLCFAAGAIVLMVSIGRYIDRVGSDLLSLIGCVFFGLFVVGISFVGSPTLVATLVFLAGAGFGTLDVSMNTTASHLERQSQRHLMSSFHALFSVGNLVGAFLVGKLVAHGVGLQGCLGAAGFVVIATALLSRVIARRQVQNEISAIAAEAKPAALNLSRAQVMLVSMFGAIGFLSMLAEGGMMDWTAVYLVNTLSASESVGAYAFGIFAGAMAAGRFAGDIIVSRVGHINVIRAGALVCAAAVIFMLIMPSIPVTMVCLGLCGFGVANMVPAVFASAGHVGGNAAGKAMSMVTTMGYSGLLLGPAFLGFIAQSLGLMVSFIVISAAFVIITAGTVLVSKRIARHGIKLAHGA